MAVFKCKMCGGDLEITEGSNICECLYCGTEQTVPGGDDEKRVKLFNRANQLRSRCEFDAAENIYSSITAEFPDEAEAYWGLCLCRYGIEYVENPTTHAMKPTCHRTEYGSILNDSDYLQALERSTSISRHLYEDEAKEIDRLQKEILAIVEREEPYDIFICYKETDADGERTKDSVIAMDIYKDLTREGYKVFFARITLQGKLGEAYEPIIFSALRSARVMLVIGTKPEHFNAVWVKNEWSRFQKMMKNDPTKKIFPCYADMDAYEIPKEINSFQAQDLSKMGADQDLVWNIGKYIPKKTAQQPAAQAAAQAPAAVNTAVESLLTRAEMKLQSAKWDEAKELYEEAVKEDPKDCRAHLGVIMAECKVMKKKSLAKMGGKFILSENFQYIKKFGDRALKEELQGYVDNWSEQQKRKDEAAKAAREEGQRKKAEATRLQREREEEKKREHELLMGRVGTVKITPRIVDGFKIEAGDLTEYSGSETEIRIPDGVQRISSRCFNENETVRKVIISEGVKKIGYAAFSSCEALEEVSIPSTVTYIGEQAFAFCKALKKAVLKCGDAAVDNDAFTYCRALEEVELPEGLKAIPEKMFEQCEKLERINIPDSVTKIGESAFYGCQSLKALSVPDGVTEIGKNAFLNCTSLKTIKLPKEYRGSAKLNEIGIYLSTTSVEGLSPEKTAAKAPAPSDDEEWVCGKCGYKQKGGDECEGCGSPRRSGSGGSGSSGGDKVDVELTSVGMLKMTVAKELISSGVCGSLSEAYVATENAPLILKRGVPRAEAQALADKLKDLGAEMTLKAEGSPASPAPAPADEIPDYENTMREYKGHEERVTVSAGVEALGVECFRGNTAIKSVVLPEGLKLIGVSAFEGCTSLEAVTIPDSVEYLQMSAFDGCSSLREIKLPRSLKKTEKYVFDNCTSLKRVIVPEEVDDLPAGLFKSCPKLEYIELPEEFHAPGVLNSLGIDPDKTTVAKPSDGSAPAEAAASEPEELYRFFEETIDKYYGHEEHVVLPEGYERVGIDCFSENTSLKSVVIPNGVKHISIGAFNGCSRLESVVIPDSVEIIEMNAFAGCSSLKEITLPRGLKTMEPYVLDDCAGLSRVVVPEEVSELPDELFDGLKALTHVTLPQRFNNEAELKRLGIDTGRTKVETASAKAAAPAKAAVQAAPAQPPVNNAAPVYAQPQAPAYNAAPNYQQPVYGAPQPYAQQTVDPAVLQAQIGQRINALTAEAAALNSELANLKGLFSGKRRKEIQDRLQVISDELAVYGIRMN